jgi:hypothetical protein
MDKEPAPQSELKIEPFTTIRYEEGYRVFGFQRTQLAEQIKRGAIPAPKYLGAPPSRVKGWTGDQIIKHFRDLEAAQAERAAAARKVYEEKLKPGQRKPKAAEAAAARPKVKKLKLRRPVKG